MLTWTAAAGGEVYHEGVDRVVVGEDLRGTVNNATTPVIYPASLTTSLMVGGEVDRVADAGGLIEATRVATESQIDDTSPHLAATPSAFSIGPRS